MASGHPQFYTRVSIDDDPVIAAYKKDIDRTAIRENLKSTPEQRLLQLMQLQLFAAELQAAGRRSRGR